MVEEAVEDRGGDGGVVEDLAPGGDAAVGGEDDRAVFVAAADDLEEEISVTAVLREVADLVDHEETGACGVVVQAAIETARRFLSAEIEEKLRGRHEEHGVAGVDRFVRDVLRDHCFTESLRSDEHDVARIGEEVETKR